MITFCTDKHSIVLGRLTFEEFFKIVDQAQKDKGRGERSRKRKADGDYVYEDDNDFEAEDDLLGFEDNEDDSWMPESPKATGWPSEYYQYMSFVLP